ncbi:MAG TPA: hypothetical protein VFQ91_16150 [Bryobacteraceae bacterium]|nr:hypothetical protein [Bryobacteraceae bacterium]
MGLQERQMIRDLTEKTLPEREKEITEICGGAARYEVDWDSLSSDAEALRFLDNISCHRLNMALRSISIDPMGKEALRDGLKIVKLRNVKSKDEMKMDFRDGVLEMHCAYALRTDGMFSDTEIYKTLMGGL